MSKHSIQRDEECKSGIQSPKNGKPVPISHNFLQCHMLFSIKMDDVRQKARFVAGDHRTKAPATIMSASVVSIERVERALLVAISNVVEVKLGNTLNAVFFS